MKIRITKDCMTTIDNFILKDFKAGEVVDLRESAACRLIQRGSAIFINETQQQMGSN